MIMFRRLSSPCNCIPRLLPFCTLAYPGGSPLGHMEYASKVHLYVFAGPEAVLQGELWQAILV